MLNKKGAFVGKTILTIQKMHGAKIKIILLLFTQHYTYIFYNSAIK
jgi:hypothetical protein